jgi:hypothetical protein
VKIIKDFKSSILFLNLVNVKMKLIVKILDVSILPLAIGGLWVGLLFIQLLAKLCSIFYFFDIASCAPFVERNKNNIHIHCHAVKNEKEGI